MKWWAKLQHWFSVTLPGLGVGGIFLAAFLDSSVFSLPLINDLLLVELSILHPARMPVYAAMATLGSLAGGLVVFYISRKGGEAYFKRHAGGRSEQVRRWLQKNAFLSVAVPAILPPPIPFKLFVIGAGVFQVGVREFCVALVTGRGFRYFALGILAVKYGKWAEQAIIEHKLAFALVVLFFLVASYLAWRLAFRNRTQA
ncbi:MAG TPA: VTT domain-containing protein [Patescibacteria group bacterium]|nr:VTT domain-containing protein [Patescibacteria group bacterium]